MEEYSERRERMEDVTRGRERRSASFVSSQSPLPMIVRSCNKKSKKWKMFPFICSLLLLLDLIECNPVVTLYQRRGTFPSHFVPSSCRKCAFKKDREEEGRKSGDRKREKEKKRVREKKMEIEKETIQIFPSSSRKTTPRISI